MSYVARVDGVDCTFVDDSTVFEWQIRGGVLAVPQTWEMPTHQVNEIVREKAGQEVTLELDGKTIERVIILGNAPTRDPLTQLLVMTDVRWYWTRQWLVRDFNLRRRTGDRRIVGNGPPQVAQIVSDIAYAPWSINEGKPWTWEAAVKNVLDEAVKASNGRPEIQWVQDPSKFAVADRVVEEAYIDDGLPIGIAKALAGIPGRDLYVDLKGVVHVYDRLPGAEIEFVKSLPEPLRGHASFVLVDCSAFRAKKYRSLFDVEAEVRVDVGGTEDAELPWAENVLRNPNVSQEVPASGTRAARTVGQGAILKHTEAYAAFGPGTNKITMPALSDDLISKRYIAGDLVWLYALKADGAMDPVWAAQVEEAQTTFRTLFRLNPRFNDKKRSMKAKLASIGDTETGTRADSPVYCDHAIMPVMRHPRARAAVGANVTSWNALIVNCKRAPAKIRILDEEQGVFFVDWQKDTTGKYAEVTPSAINSPPTLEVSNDTLREQGWSTRRLVQASEFKLSTIISMVPSAPNDSRRLFAVEATLEEAAARLGVAGLGELVAKGPDQDIRSRLVTARFGWQDDDTYRNLIYELFGAFTRGPVNPDSGVVATALQPLNEEEVKAVAVANAAFELINRLDHIEGIRSTPGISETFVPVGTIVMVSHRVTKDSAETTMVAVAPQIPADPMSLLPPHIQKVVAREVQP